MLEEYLILSSESDSDTELETLLLLYQKSRKAKLWKSEYMKKRGTHGAFAQTKEFSHKQFVNYFGLNRAEFEEVHNLIQPIIYSEGCNAQTPIGTEEKLAVFLRYLLSGDSYKFIGNSYRMGDRTVAKIVNEVSQAIWKTMESSYLPQPTKEKWLSIASDFESKWNFPHCLSAISGKYIVIKNPNESVSVILMAGVDANYKFTFIDVESIERLTDENIFSNCLLSRKLEKGTLDIPLPADLPSFEHKLPYVFIGDDSFSVMQNLMRPYPKKSILDNHENKVFNYRLLQARQTVEETFSILSSRFQVFQKPFETKVTSVVNVVKAACILHNYLRRNTVIISRHEHVDIYKNLPTKQLLPISPTRSRSTIAAISIRRKFTEYFNSVGSIPWQEKIVT